MAVFKFFRDHNVEISKEDLEKISTVFNKMKLSVREVKRCVERIITLMKSSDNKNLELYAYVACRYDKDFDKIADMKHINDYDHEEGQLFSKRMKLFENFCENCRGIPSNKKIGNACINIARKFCITKYIETDFRVFDYSTLQNNIRDYYQVICKDSGNAKKLAEIFLSDLFEEIDKALENTK